MITLSSDSGQVTGWQGFVAVDGVVYNWMGAAIGPAVVNETSATYTSTQTVFTFDVEGKITLTATFLSPVYPDDLVKQSLQYSYVDVTAVSADGASHSVQVYMDTSGGTSCGVCLVLRKLLKFKSKADNMGLRIREW